MRKRRFRNGALRTAAIAGAAGGAVYLATMEIDNRLTGRDIDDLKLLGRPFVRDPRFAKLAGLPIHFNNAIVLAAAYGKVARHHLPGPPWLRGVIFANLENTLLYPLIVFEERHPGIHRGEIDRYFTLNAYLQSIPRHITYGAVMATLYEWLAER